MNSATAHKNTHLHFLLHLLDYCVDLDALIYLRNTIDSYNVKIRLAYFILADDVLTSHLTG